MNPFQVYTLSGAVIMMLVLCLIFTGLVFYRYRQANAMNSRMHGLMPLHVTLISIGVSGLQATLAWGLIEGLDRVVFTPSLITRFSMYGLFSLIILIALFVVSNIQMKRKRFYDENPEFIQLFKEQMAKDKTDE